MVCRQLGFSRALEAYGITDNNFDPLYGYRYRYRYEPTAVVLHCEGQETSLDDCLLEPLYDEFCGAGITAGARCQGLYSSVTTVNKNISQICLSK